ncbi:MAG TPA: hypothetical protein VK600_00520 [Candidatus Saccharimonadales bacterium]|nr:hypothetical protein [Candidatus Saccharimonadales bacterium]
MSQPVIRSRALIGGHSDGAHRPASHPVLRSLGSVPPPVFGTPFEIRILDPAAEARFTDVLDELARLTWDLPQQSPTDAQARLLVVIARELTRRAHL